jgi:hypothetical protein
MATTNTFPKLYNSFYYSEGNFKGLITIAPIPKGSKVTVLGVNYNVRECQPLQVTCFTKVGKYKFQFGDHVLKDRAKIHDFLNQHGFVDINTFVSAFFQRPIIEGTNAYINVWLISL